MSDKKKLNHEDYTVGWICPLEVEQIAALEMLDEEHERLGQQPADHNVYTLGEIHSHNVVIAGLPTTGNNPAATVVAQMRTTFPQIRFGLLVVIGGGVPVKTDNGMIRLGDVIVSKPTGVHSGAVQYDHGKAEVGEFKRTGALAPPPAVLLNAAQDLAARRARARKDPIAENLKRIDTSIRGLRRYKFPGRGEDILFKPDYIHLDRNLSCKKCGCDTTQCVEREVDQDDEDEDDDDDDGGSYVVVHRGTIAAGEAVLKNGIKRDELANENGVLCFEMEAAGALNDFPCIVVRGVSDYCDSHKNDKWHGYAAGVAAAYARQLFAHMPIDEVRRCVLIQ
ncbi:ankyrin repeat protein [Lentithecium fluviatile CBS 122367]|uniref:Ankyrin repeat protein n=1 Tax=Lentithecium fluviatile CBS 122367 TaxID=1168545 RepID=A0A6G1ICF7_9PLEO|nr:ankyrin repeat protein [Lentithecium fluviatile CBS 122367]